jgi:hypothetical protein
MRNGVHEASNEAREAGCEIGGAQPISALTHEFSIGWNRNRQTDDFEPRFVELPTPNGLPLLAGRRKANATNREAACEATRTRRG